MAEGGIKVPDTGVDLLPGIGHVVEAGSVGFLVVDDGFAVREEALRVAVPLAVGVHVLQLEHERVGQVLEPFETRAGVFDAGEILANVGDGPGLTPVLVEERVDAVELG